jgi:hypothetical protein
MRFRLSEGWAAVIACAKRPTPYLAGTTAATAIGVAELAGAFVLWFITPPMLPPVMCGWSWAILMGISTAALAAGVGLFTRPGRGVAAGEPRGQGAAPS